MSRKICKHHGCFCTVQVLIISGLFRQGAGWRPLALDLECASDRASGRRSEATALQCKIKKVPAQRPEGKRSNAAWLRAATLQRRTDIRPCAQGQAASFLWPPPRPALPGPRSRQRGTGSTESMTGRKNFGIRRRETGAGSLKGGVGRRRASPTRVERVKAAPRDSSLPTGHSVRGMI